MRWCRHAKFFAFGGVGIVWVIVWRRMFRDDPANDPDVNEAERALITAGRGVATTTHEGWAYWRRLLTHRNTLPTPTPITLPPGLVGYL